MAETLEDEIDLDHFTDVMFDIEDSIERENRDCELDGSEKMGSKNTKEVQAPDFVKAVPRMRTDVQAISSMFSALEPPIIQVRSKDVLLAIYGFGDASGLGFGWL